MRDVVGILDKCVEHVDLTLVRGFQVLKVLNVLSVLLLLFADTQDEIDESREFFEPLRITFENSLAELGMLIQVDPDPTREL